MSEQEGRRNLVLFYSWSGNTREIARLIAQKTGADLEVVSGSGQGPVHTPENPANSVGAALVCQLGGADHQRPCHGPPCPAISGNPCFHCRRPADSPGLRVLELPADGAPPGSALGHIPGPGPETAGRTAAPPGGAPALAPPALTLWARF